MDENNKKPEISKPLIQKDKKIDNLWWYLASATLIIIILFLSTIFHLFTNYLDFIIALFGYFEKSEQIFQFIISLMGSFGLKELTTVFIGLFSYFYLFEYVRKKGVRVFAEEGKESKYFCFLLSLYSIFNFMVVVPLGFFYLLFVKGDIFELLIILVSYFVTKFVFANLMDTCKRIVYDYKSLSALSPLLISREFKSIGGKAKSDFEGVLHKSINAKTLPQRILGYASVKSWMGGGVWYILGNVSQILKAIFILTFLVLLFGLIWGFNVLSIVYIELTLMVWYFILSAVSYLPKKTQNIKLNTGEVLKEVYIIEDSPKGHIFALTPQNKEIRIMKNSIAVIE